MTVISNSATAGAITSGATVVVGGGGFGAAAALALARRGAAVTLVEPGPVPHPLAESNDVSKVVRVDYGGDVLYTALAERALDAWRRFPAPIFHETGVAFLARAALAPGGFEHESLALLTARGHRPLRLGSAEIARRFPALAGGALCDGYFHASGGWVESGRAVAVLVDAAAAAGARVVVGRRVERVVTAGARVAGVALAENGGVISAERVVLAAGAWTGDLLAALDPTAARCFRTVGQPVYHLVPANPALYSVERLPVFGADISRTGWYGFPLHPTRGVVKIANHGAGRAMSPDAERRVTPAEVAALRRFLGENLPDLATAPLVESRICVYGDTLDGHFWIDRHPAIGGLVVAAGGSGHAFKFTSVIGELIADVAGGAPAVARFRHRPEIADGEPPAGDAARGGASSLS